MKSSAKQSWEVNRKELEDKVKSIYRDVALHPKAPFHFEIGRGLAERLGYPAAILDQVPFEATDSFAGVGCYFHLAEMQPGERVADLGSGSGMDAFIAAMHTGRSGEVVGIDMTDEQLAKARKLANRYGFHQVRFVKGNIEDLPLAEATIDKVISNGVINLAADKGAVFREAARVLRPGGRLVLADIVSNVELPTGISCNATFWAARIGGAMQIDQYTNLIIKSGMKVILVEDNSQYAFISENTKNATSKYGIKSISLLAIKK